MKLIKNSANLYDILIRHTHPSCYSLLFFDFTTRLFHSPIAPLVSLYLRLSLSQPPFLIYKQHEKCFTFPIYPSHKFRFLLPATATAVTPWHSFEKPTWKSSIRRKPGNKSSSFSSRYNHNRQLAAAAAFSFANKPERKTSTFI